MDQDTVRKLSKLCLEMDDLLDRLIEVHANDTSERDNYDLRWALAMADVEEGFTEAVSVIASFKKMRLPPFFSSEDVERILRT
jgi:hypothetical protein